MIFFSSLFLMRWWRALQNQKREKNHDNSIALYNTVVVCIYFDCSWQVLRRQSAFGIRSETKTSKTFFDTLLTETLMDGLDNLSIVFSLYLLIFFSSSKSMIKAQNGANSQLVFFTVSFSSLSLDWHWNSKLISEEKKSLSCKQNWKFLNFMELDFAHQLNWPSIMIDFYWQKVLLIVHSMFWFEKFVNP